MFASSPFTSVSNSAEDACKNKTTVKLKHGHTSTNGHLLTTATIFKSVTAFVSCYCFIIVSAVIVLGLGSLFLLFVLLSHSCETLRELQPDPIFSSQLRDLLLS